MSYQETSEERTIRNLRSEVSRLTTQNQTLAHQRTQDLQQIRAQTAEQNRKLEEMIRRQTDLMSREQTAANQQIQALSRELDQQDQIHLQRIQTLQTQHENELHTIRTQVQAENSRLQDQILNTRAEMNQALHNIRTETDQALEQQRRQTSQAMNNLEARLSGRVADVRQQVENLEAQLRQQKDGDRQLAEFWLEQAQSIHTQLLTGFHNQLLEPQQLRELELELNLARSDCQQGQFTLAMGKGRDAYFHGLQLREDTTAEEFRWNSLLNQSQEQLSQLLSSLRQAEGRVYEFELNQESYRDENGIDYWTGGGLSRIAREAAAIQAQDQALDTMTLQQLAERSRRISQLQQQLIQTEQAAHTNLTMSLERQQIAVRIGEVLGDSYAMVSCDGDFMGLENNDAFHAIYLNPRNGDQAAVTITPLMGEDGIVVNHLDFLVSPASNRLEDGAQMTEAVARDLRRSGIDGCCFPCSHRYGSNTRQEIQRVGDIEQVARGSETARADLPGTTR